MEVIEDDPRPKKALERIKRGIETRLTLLRSIGVAAWRFGFSRLETLLMTNEQSAPSVGAHEDE